MSSSHKRRVLIIGILGVLFAAGAGCLAYTVVGTPGTTTVGSDIAGGPDEEGTGPSDLASAEGAPPAGSSSGGDTTPPKPRRSIEVNGVDLDGDVAGDNCVIVLNKAEVPVSITSVQVASADGVVKDPSGCPQGNSPRCDGAQLAPSPDGECYVGVRLTGNKAAGSYTVTVGATMHATCTSARLTPCNQVAGRLPSAANPVGIYWPSALEDVEVYVSTGSDHSDSESQPGDEESTPSTPDTSPTPDESPVPESAPVEQTS